MAKYITNEEVVWIREAYATGKFTYKELGKIVGCTASNIHLIVMGKSRPKAGGPIVTSGRHHGDHSDMTDEEVSKIIDMFNTGMTKSQIANELDITVYRVHTALYGARFRHLRHNMRRLGKHADMTDEEAAEIIGMYQRMCRPKIAEELGIDEKRVISALYAKRFAHLREGIRHVRNSRLTHDEVRMIRESYRDRTLSAEKMAEIAGFNTIASIYAIIRGISYVDAPGPIKGRDY